MKIIKDNYTKLYECVCPNCSSIFRFTKDEVNVTYDLNIFCPLCKVKIHLGNRGENIKHKSVKQIAKKEK